MPPAPATCAPTAGSTNAPCLSLRDREIACGYLTARLLVVDDHDAMASSDGLASDVTFRQVVAGLDPVMVPLGFASGQGGVAGDTGQVVYCSIHPSGDGRCADVVLNLRRTDGWQIVAVSYDGFHDDHVEQLRLREGVGLPEQLGLLRTTIPDDLNQWTQ